MYDKIVNLKSKLANFNNSSISINKPVSSTNKKALNNTCIVTSPTVYEMTEETNYRNINAFDNKSKLETSIMNSGIVTNSSKPSNQPIMSKINELKKKWNEVSSKNKPLSNVPVSPNKMDKNRSIDESMFFNSNINTSMDVKLAEERRFNAPKLKNLPSKK